MANFIYRLTALGAAVVLSAHCVLPAAALAEVADESPALEKSDLFQARQGGYHIYRIPGIVVARKGAVLAWCEARKNDPWDYGDIDIVLRRSADRGATWSEPVVLVDAGEAPAHNGVAIADRAGGLHFLYCTAYSRCFYKHSRDDGATFSEPVEITDVFAGFRPQYDWQLIATGPGHGLELASGRLLARSPLRRSLASP